MDEYTEIFQHPAGTNITQLNPTELGIAEDCELTVILDGVFEITEDDSEYGVKVCGKAGSKIIASGGNRKYLIEIT